MPLSGKTSCWMVIALPEAPRLACGLQEGTGYVEELANFQQEGIMTAVGLDFGKRHPSAGGVERMHERARLRGRKQPIAGERHDAEPGLDLPERLREDSVVIGGNVEIIHGPRQVKIAVGVEPLDKR